MGEQFGKYEEKAEKRWKVGDTVENVYATPHVECVAKMLGWNNDTAFERDGGFSWSYVIEILAEEYYHPSPNEYYLASTDRDEVIIKKGKVTAVLSQKEFANKYGVIIGDMYKFLYIFPEKKQ